MGNFSAILTVQDKYSTDCFSFVSLSVGVGNFSAILTVQDKYSTELLSTRAVQIVQNSNSSEPFFVYLAYQAAHRPAEVPQRYIDKYCSHVTNALRQIHCAMMATADEGIGQVVQALKDKVSNLALKFSSLALSDK